MSFEALRQVNFSSREKPFEPGEHISNQDFAREIPDLRRRERIIAQLLDQGRIARAAEGAQVVEQQPTRLKYIPVDRWELPNGEVLKGKANALARLDELREE